MATILKYSNKTILEKDFKWYTLIMRQQQNHTNLP
jgi:hypothetical protein